MPLPPLLPIRHGEAFDGPLAGCIVFLDLAGDGLWKVGEPFAVTDELGFFALEAPRTQNYQVLLSPTAAAASSSNGCVDAHTNLVQRLALVMPPVGKASVLSPLSTLVAATMPEGVTGATAENAGREAGVQLKRKLGLNESSDGYTSLDLLTFSPYGHLRIGINPSHPVLALQLAVQSMQVHTMALQLATITSESNAWALRYSDKSLSPDEAPIQLEAFGHIAFSSIAQELRRVPSFAMLLETSRLQAILSTAEADLGGPKLKAALSKDDLDAVVTAMQNSYDLLERRKPTPRETWVELLIRLHDKVRAGRCLHLLDWDANLAEGSALRASSCPASGATKKSSTRVVGAELVGEFPESMSVMDGVQKTFKVWETALNEGVSAMAQLVSLDYSSFGCSIARNCFIHAQETVGYSLVCQYRGSPAAAQHESPPVSVRTAASVSVKGSSLASAACPLERRQEALREAAKAAKVVNGYVPRQIIALVRDELDVPAFLESITLQALEAATQQADVPLLPFAAPPSPPAHAPFQPLSDTPYIERTPDVDETHAQGLSGGEKASVIVPCLIAGMILMALAIIWCISRGNLRLWMKVHLSHSNRKVAFFYIAPEQRERKRAELYGGDSAGVVYRAMERHLSGYGATSSKKSTESADFSQNYTEHPASSSPVQATPKPPVPTQPAVPYSNGLNSNARVAASDTVTSEAADISDVTLREVPPIGNESSEQEEDDEPESERLRRIEWIKYYVRTNDAQKAYDLGWDGKPFRLSFTDALPVARNTTRI